MVVIPDSQKGSRMTGESPKSTKSSNEGHMLRIRGGRSSPLSSRQHGARRALQESINRLATQCEVNAGKLGDFDSDSKMFLPPSPLLSPSPLKTESRISVVPYP